MSLLETVKNTLERAQQSELGRKSLTEVEQQTFELIPDGKQSIYLTVSNGGFKVGTERPEVMHPDRLIPISGPEQALLDVFDGKIRVADAVFKRGLIAPVYGKYSYLLAFLAKLIRIASEKPNFRHKY